MGTQGILILVGVFVGVVGLFVIVGFLIDRASRSKRKDRWCSPAEAARRRPEPRAKMRRPRALTPGEPLSARLVRPLARLWPMASSSQRQVRELLVHAGIRERRAVEIFTGAKLALAVALPLALTAFMVWWTGRNQGTLQMKKLLMYDAGALIFGMLLPQMWLRGKARKRIENVRLSLPDVLDLLIVCIESGLGLDAAFVRISRDMADVAPEFCEELVLLNLEIAAGKPREECMRHLGIRTGCDEVESLMARINKASKYGTNLGESLRIHSESLRQKRRHEAEERAAKTTVKLLFPLIFFIFPAIFVVILGPAMVRVSEAFK